jgi:hypothetical protein
VPGATRSGSISAASPRARASASLRFRPGTPSAYRHRAVLDNRSIDPPAPDRSPQQHAGQHAAERAAPTPAPTAQGLPERLARWVVPDVNPAGVVYGIILIGALLAAESGEHDSFLDMFISAVIAAALYWVAHAYAELLGERVTAGERLTAAGLGRALVHDWTIVRGAAVPLAVLAISWAAGASQQTGATAAMWSAIATLVAFELIAGLRAHSSGRELALNAGVGASMGIAILALKIVLR